jgi:hypothetical protein
VYFHQGTPDPLWPKKKKATTPQPPPVPELRAVEDWDAEIAVNSSLLWLFSGPPISYEKTLSIDKLLCFIDNIHMFMILMSKVMNKLLVMSPLATC